MLHRLRQSELGLGQPSQHPPPGWSRTLVKRLWLERKLEGHDGCVNTVHFSPDGQLLVSGSDDLQIMFWDWQLGAARLAFHSGHSNNVFQARVMPESGNGTVVSCAADGVVRVAAIPQGCGGAAVETRRLACHRGRAHKLALEPGSPHCFLSCGEDGEVRHFDLRQPAGAARRLLACRTQHGRLELNSVHCCPRSHQFCVAGGDPFVRVYDLRRVRPAGDIRAEPVRRLAPWHLRTRRSLLTITCAVFDQQGQVLASYNDENIYLFSAEGPAAPAAGVQNAAAANRHKPAPHAAVDPASGNDARPGSKRVRRAGPERSDSSERDDAGGRRAAAAARAQSQHRRAAAAAALAQEQATRGAAAAAAGVHAGVRRSFLREEGEALGGDPPPPALLADPSAGSGLAVGVREGRQDGAASPTGASVGSDGLGFAAAPQQQQQQQEEQQQGQQDPSGSGPGVAARASNTLAGSRSGGREAGSSGAPEGDALGGGGVAGGRLGVGLELSGSQGVSDSEGEDEDEGTLPQGAIIDDAVGSASSELRHSSSDGGDEERPDDCVLQAYKGHRNYRTVKGVSFLGRDDEFVMSGSDCGHVYVWDARSGEVLAMLKGDADTVNCLEPHPHHLLAMATSGIEETVKVWGPTAEEPQVLGEAARRRMAANQRAQGEERRMFISPEMLQLLLRARQLDALRGSDSEEVEEDEDDDEDGSDAARRRAVECSIC